MKKVIVVLVVLFIGILFAGCTSQSQTPAATPTPTVVPTVVATPVPTVVPNVTSNTTANMTANVTANVTAVPTAVPMPAPVKITFSQTLTISPTGTLYVPVNTTVSWYNADPYKPHGIQSVGIQAAKYFGTIEIPYGKTFNVTFSQPGTYQYATIFQPVASGTIVVK